MLRLEVSDVLPERLGQLPLGPGGLDVLPLQALHVCLIEYGRHWRDGLEEVGDGLDVLVPIQHARVDRGGVGIVRHRIPGAEDQVVE